ncbi:hypothetical protein D9M72_571370 [compost metagenome]
MPLSTCTKVSAPPSFATQVRLPAGLEKEREYPSLATMEAVTGAVLCAGTSAMLWLCDQTCPMPAERPTIPLVQLLR